MTLQFRKFTPEMLANIKKYIIIAQMDSFHRKNNPGDSDAAQMLQSLLQFKEDDPR
ncbi:8943_t:CDS:2 [Racocetra persica]|uniref:8943_t:CDS:1 n=1 Tax=Racocetra persica TaxID=160502 RepID=A0ACA9RQF5_9GLOM|nr:8943_t:CDS:2 [Racocetra persica]